MIYHIDFTDADLTRFRVDSPCVGSHGNKVIVLKDINHVTRGFELKPDDLDRPHGGWIPCLERLPEDIKPVIVTWKNNDPKSYYQYIVGKHFIGTAYYLNGKWFWYSSTMEDLLAEYGRCDGEEFDEAIEVVAWMPLPEPYKEEGDKK